MSETDGIIFVDLETQRLLDEVGGRNNIAKLGLAAGVTYSSTTEEYHWYTESRVHDLVAELRSAELVVGYNVLEFDYEVLRGYDSKPLNEVPTIDLMLHLAERLGFRVSLESVAAATLGTGKSADGRQARRWYRQGAIDKVLAYCQKDVEITRRLYEHGKMYKMVHYWDRQWQRKMAPVNW
jgi:DEAD/DEAH box helicase domain-containing protein